MTPRKINSKKVGIVVNLETTPLAAIAAVTSMCELYKEKVNNSTVMKKPCNECPYRKASLKGWLGEDSGKPEKFLMQLEFKAHPCHKTVDWDQPEQGVEEEADEAPICVGAMQFMNNSLMLSRHPDIARIQKEYGKNEDVLQYKHNFIEHHKQ